MVLILSVFAGDKRMDVVCSSSACFVWLAVGKLPH